MSMNIEAQVVVDNLGSSICSPFFDKTGNLHVVFSDTGQIGLMRPGNEEIEEVHNTDGQPSCAVFSQEGALYITDFTHGSVLVAADPIESTQTNKDFRSERQDLVVSVYEDKPLKGPGSIAFDPNGNIFFTDSGPFGETGIHNATGSLFTITSGVSTQILKPVVLEKLAGPSGIAIAPNGKFIYVTEMMTNRVLRFFERPTGVYHGSVFYQMAGGVGPSSVTCDELGYIYVACFDVKENSKEGKVLVLSPGGDLKATIKTLGAEVSGVAVFDGILYITERSTGGILKCNVNEIN